MGKPAAGGRGGFLVTKFGATDDKSLLNKLSAGKPTGAIYRWSPGQGYRENSHSAVAFLRAFSEDRSMSEVSTTGS